MGNSETAQSQPQMEPMLVRHPLTNQMAVVEKERTLVIGTGEVGKALATVLTIGYMVETKDKDPSPLRKYRVINICYPYSENFVETTKEYINFYNPEIAIIHSTVPVGTTRKIGPKAVHSPVNGKHPRLQESLLLFTKFIGASSTFSAYATATYLQKAQMRTQVFSSPEATELAKIMCTTYYGWNIVFMKELARICDKEGVPFHEVYTEWNNQYNQGYSAFKDYQFIRPVLFPLPGPIGGHCVIPNCDLLEDFLTDTIKKRNKTYDTSKAQ